MAFSHHFTQSTADHTVPWNIGCNIPSAGRRKWKTNCSDELWDLSLPSGEGESQRCWAPSVLMWNVDMVFSYNDYANLCTKACFAQNLPRPINCTHNLSASRIITLWPVCLEMKWSNYPNEDQLSRSEGNWKMVSSSVASVVGEPIPRSSNKGGDRNVTLW